MITNESGDFAAHPIFLGPIFLHGHSDFMTYNYFFSHLAAFLMIVLVDFELNLPEQGMSDVNDLPDNGWCYFPSVGTEIKCNNSLFSVPVSYTHLTLPTNREV